MATKKSKENYEEVYIPKAQANEDKTMFVSVNGKSALVPRGQTVRVSPEMAWEIRRSLKALEIQEKNSQEMMERNAP